MTPKEARRLLDGTTPAYEWWADIGGFDRIRRAGPIEWGATGDGLECTESDAWLIAAAPEMAAMIAGMREEWGREARIMGDTAWRNLGWFRSRAEAELTDWTRSLPRGAKVEYRIVRRYITEPEEA